MTIAFQPLRDAPSPMPLPGVADGDHSHSRNIPSQPSVSSLHDSYPSFEYGTQHGPAHTWPGPEPPASQHGAQPNAVTGPPDKQVETAAGPPMQYHVFRYWLWEFVSTVLAIGLLVAIIVLLTTYDGLPTPEWGYSVNLNTLLALLATLFRILILIPITSIIAQSKWDWVGRDQGRLLSDIQDIDTASRGPWGAICVIPLAAKGNIPALVAAVMSVLSLATAPFVQQALRTVSCQLPVQGVATIPYAHYVPRLGSYYQIESMVGGGRPGRPGASVNLQVLVQSTQAAIGTPNAKISGTCSTGNCTFPDGDPTDDGHVSHSTIAMCHRCTDVSSLIIHTSDEEPSISLPSGANAGLDPRTQIWTSLDSNLTWAGDVLATPELLHLANATLLNITTMVNSGGQEYTAVTCMLYTCLRSYNTSIYDGQVQEEELAPIPAQPDLATAVAVPYPDGLPAIADLAVVKTPCRANGVVYSAQNISTAPDATKMSFCETSEDGRSCEMRDVAAPEACIYRQGAYFANSMRSALMDAFASGNCKLVPNVRCFTSLISTENWLSKTIMAVKDLEGSYPALRSGPSPAAQWIDDAFANFALSMSTQYRTLLGAASNEGPKRSDLVADEGFEDYPLGELTGQAWQTTACSAAQLPWLAMPLALAAITAALLAWMVARSWRRRAVQPVWKESVLPLVLYNDNLLRNNTTHEFDTVDGGFVRISQGGEPLLELNQMARVANRIPVDFKWNDWPSASEEAGLRKRAKVERSDVDSLLQEPR